MTIPSYHGGGQLAKVDNEAHPLHWPRHPHPRRHHRRRLRHRRQAADAYSGVAPDVDIISIRQSSQAFGLKDAYTGDEDPSRSEDHQH